MSSEPAGRGAPIDLLALGLCGAAGLGVGGVGTGRLAGFPGIAVADAARAGEDALPGTAYSGERTSRDAYREALAYYTGCLESGRLSEGWDGFRSTLERMSSRRDSWRDAQTGALVLVGSYVRYGRTFEASTFLADFLRAPVAFSGKRGPSEPMSLILVAEEWLPLIAARTLLADGRSLPLPSQLLITPPVEPREHRLFVARLRVQGFECASSPWGEADLFHLALQYQLTRIQACVDVVPYEVTALSAARLGSGYAIDSVDVGLETARLAFALGCDALLTPIALCNADGIYQLDAYLYAPGKPPTYERGVPEVLDYQRITLHVTQHDLLSEAGSLGDWVRARLAPGCATSGVAGVRAPEDPSVRSKLRAISNMLACGNAEGAAQRLTQLRKEDRAARESSEWEGLIRYLEAAAASRLAFGTPEEFYDRAIRQGSERWGKPRFGTRSRTGGE